MTLDVLVLSLRWNARLNSGFKCRLMIAPFRAKVKPYFQRCLKTL